MSAGDGIPPREAESGGRCRPGLWRWIAAAALFGLGGLTGYLLHTPDRSQLYRQVWNKGFGPPKLDTTIPDPRGCLLDPRSDLNSRREFVLGLESATRGRRTAIVMSQIDSALYEMDNLSIIRVNLLGLRDDTIEEILAAADRAAALEGMPEIERIITSCRGAVQ